MSLSVFTVSCIETLPVEPSILQICLLFYFQMLWICHGVFSPELKHILQRFCPLEFFEVGVAGRMGGDASGVFGYAHMEHSGFNLFRKLFYLSS